MIDIGQPDMGRLFAVAQHVAGAGTQRIRVHSGTVVLDGDDAVGPLVVRDDLHRSALPAGQPVPDGVLHQGLQGEERHHHGEDLRRDPQRHRKVGAEPGPLQNQVAVDIAQLVGQHGVGPGGPERVSGEVGELQDQLAGAVGVGAHERGDGRQGVVDEMRADLCPQREHLRTVQPCPGGVEFGQLKLAGRIAGDLADRSQHSGRGFGVVDRHQRAQDGAVVVEQRLAHHHEALFPAQYPAPAVDGLSGGAQAFRSGRRCPDLAARRVGGQEVGVGAVQRQSVGAGQRPQVRRGIAGGVGVQAFAQRTRGQ